MSQRQVLILAATLAALGAGASAGEARRAWIDPPAQVLAVPPGRDDSPDAPASNTEAWPDEASRRRVPHRVEAATAGPPEHDAPAQEAAAGPPAAQAPRFAAAAPAVSRRTRNRLGPLAGFAAVTGPKSAIATDPQASQADVGPAREVRRSLSRMRTLQFRNRRVLVIYTRS